MRERIIASDETDQTWNAEPVFTIRSVDEAALSSASYLADTIIRNFSDEIQNATGIHVNGQLVGVVTDGAALQQVLDDTLARTENGDEFHRVAFAQDIELVPGIYYTSSIEDLATVTDTLRADPTYLQVQITDREEYDDVQPYETITQESDDYYEGTQRVIQRGVNGRQHVVADVTRVNGEEVSREIVQTTVLEEMTPRIVVVGTKSYDFCHQHRPCGLGQPCRSPCRAIPTSHPVRAGRPPRHRYLRARGHAPSMPVRAAPWWKPAGITAGATMCALTTAAITRCTRTVRSLRCRPGNRWPRASLLAWWATRAILRATTAIWSCGWIIPAPIPA